MYFLKFINKPNHENDDKLTKRICFMYLLQYLEVRFSPYIRQMASATIIFEMVRSAINRKLFWQVIFITGQTFWIIYKFLFFVFQLLYGSLVLYSPALCLNQGTIIIFLSNIWHKNVEGDYNPYCLRDFENLPDLEPAVFWGCANISRASMTFMFVNDILSNHASFHIISYIYIHCSFINPSNYFIQNIMSSQVYSHSISTYLKYRLWPPFI